MIRNLKAFGLALVAALALVAVAASPASAEKFHFGSTVEHTTLKGEQTGTGDVFTVHGGTVTCATISYDGTVSSATKKTTEVTINPTYSGCKFAGIPNSATIDMNSCDYLFTAKTKEGENYEGEVHVKCTTAGDTITVTVVVGGVTKCTIHIPEQSLTGITYTNVNPGGGAKTHLLVDVNITGIKYSQTEGTGGGKCETKDNTTTGTYVGQATIKGFDTENHQVSISVTKTV